MFTRACKKLGIPVKRGKDYSDEQVLVIGHVIETMLQKKGLSSTDIQRKHSIPHKRFREYVDELGYTRGQGVLYTEEQEELIAAADLPRKQRIRKSIKHCRPSKAAYTDVTGPIKCRCPTCRKEYMKEGIHVGERTLWIKCDNCSRDEYNPSRRELSITPNPFPE